ncbi:MAG: hypothetical protein NTW50_02670 [Candidatus Berkelbacteria bacterium]|nr:hypothetical protein [Candidatus Berkelbacteria bacterium]
MDNSQYFLAQSEQLALNVSDPGLLKVGQDALARCERLLDEGKLVIKAAVGISWKYVGHVIEMQKDLSVVQPLVTAKELNGLAPIFFRDWEVKVIGAYTESTVCFPVVEAALDKLFEVSLEAAAKRWDKAVKDKLTGLVGEDEFYAEFVVEFAAELGVIRKEHKDDKRKLVACQLYYELSGSIGVTERIHTERLRLAEQSVEKKQSVVDKRRAKRRQEAARFAATTANIPPLQSSTTETDSTKELVEV